MGQLFLKVIEVAAIEEPFLLQEVDEHQAVQQHRGIPTSLPLVTDALNQFNEGKVLLLEVAVESFGDPLHIQSVSDASGDFDDAGVALFVEFADVENNLAKFAHKEVARLAFDVQVVSRIALAGLAFDPVPKALRSGRVEEDQNVFVVLGENLLMDGRPSLRVWNRSAVGSDLEYDSPRKLGDLLPLETFTLDSNEVAFRAVGRDHPSSLTKSSWKSNVRKHSRIRLKSIAMCQIPSWADRSPIEQIIWGSCCWSSSWMMHSRPSARSSTTSSASLSSGIPLRSWRLSVSIAVCRNG